MMKSLYDSALSGISKLLSARIDGYKDAKENAISSLEAEKQAAEDAYQAQIDGIQEVIDSKQEIIDGINDEIDALNDQIDAIEDANAERERAINLQKAQYELERAQNQRTKLVYKDGGMSYQADTSAIREKRQNVDDAETDIKVADIQKQIDGKEKEIDLLEKEIDALEKQQDAIQELMDESAKYYDNLISQTEEYWNSMINNLEQQKSKWEQLAEIEEIAEAYSAVKQVFGDIGYTVEDVLNGSEGAFEDFKSKYLAIMSELNQNTSFLDGLEYASGVVKEKFGGIAADAGNGFLGQWAEQSTAITDAANQTAIDAVDAFAEGQESHSPSLKYKSLACDAFDGLMLGVEEKKQLFIDSVKSIAEEGVLAFSEGFTFDEDSLTAFDSLGLLIESISEAFGLETGDPIGGLLDALNQLSEFSLSGTEEGDGIISQFQNLKTAVEDVTNAISGGGSSGSKTGTDKRSSGTSAEGESGSGLTEAINTMKESVDTALGTGEDETGAIGQFTALKAKVDEVTTAIGSGEDETGSDESSNLTNALTNLGETSEEILGEPGGEGVIGDFEKMRDPLLEANEHVTGIADGLKEIDGQKVECTIAVNIEATGDTGVAQYLGTAGNHMNLNSNTYTASKGAAAVSGTALATGSWAVQSSGYRALVGELGYEIIVRNGRFFTVGNIGAEFVPIQKGDIVFNHEQSRQLLKYGHISGRGRAYADGTVGSPFASGKYKPLQEADPNAYKICSLLANINPALSENHSAMKNLTDQAAAINNTVRNTVTTNHTAPVVNITGTQFTCPGVTIEEVQGQIEKNFFGMVTNAYQKIHMK